jgi:hypothetical protein
MSTPFRLHIEGLRLVPGGHGKAADLQNRSALRLLDGVSSMWLQ